MAKSRLLANSGEATDAAPAIADPAQAERALTNVEVQIADVAATIPAQPDGAERDDRELLLQIRVATAELQQFAHGGRLETFFIQGLEHGVRTHVIVEVTQDDLCLVHLVRLEVVVSDVGIGVAVLALLDELLDAESEDVQHIDLADVDDEQLGDLLTELALLDDPTQVVVTATQSVDFLGDQLDHLEGRTQSGYEVTLLTSHCTLLLGFGLPLIFA